MSLKQRKIKFEPRIKLNYNTYIISIMNTEFCTLELNCKIYDAILPKYNDEENDLLLQHVH